MRRPQIVFAALCALSVLTFAGYFVWTKDRSSATAQPQVAAEPPRVEAPPPAPVSPASVAQAAAPEASPKAPPEAAPKAAPTPAEQAAPRQEKPAAPAAAEWSRLYFRHNAVDRQYGQIARVSRDRPDAPAFAERLTCDVVHATGKRGVCLTSDRGVVTTYSAKLFDTESFDVLFEIPLKGVPSRTRISRDGTLAGITVFLSGHGYASMDFSTQALLVDVASGKVIADLEAFAVEREGAPFRERDFNYWGITFVPGGREFYATLASGGKFMLVKGDVDKRSIVVVREGVECPSLSPDATRIAYKKRLVTAGRVTWQPAVFDLRTGRDVAIPEARNVDDQIEWLDDRHILYALPVQSGGSASTNVWKARSDGTGEPELFLRNAYSPAVVRQP